MAAMEPMEFEGVSRWQREASDAAPVSLSSAHTVKGNRTAGGTGIWSAKLLGHADQRTVVVASSEVLALNRASLRSERVQYLRAHLFDWLLPDRFDVVFFGFWLSHVPAPKFEAFLELVVLRSRRVAECSS
jgi:ubiquinone/menaquinone biosynthesis C-methylase UbiE